MLKGFDRISFVIVLFLVLVLVGCTGGGGSSTYTVTGKVTDSKDKPLAGIEIVATGGKSTKVTTKEDGTFNLALKGPCTIKPASSKYDFTPQEIKVSGKRDGLLFKAKVDESSGPGVKDVKVSGVTVNKATTTLVVGATETITATVQPSNATNKNATWTSSDDVIATVDGNGKIKAEAKGTATVTVTTADGGYKAIVEVLVLTETLGTDFEFNKSTGTITGYTGSETDLAIPAQIDGVDVKAIGDFAFVLKNLTSVIIPNSVTTIGEAAFAFNELTSLIIPNSVTSIGEGAFNNNQLPDAQAFIYARNADGSEDKSKIVSYGGAKRENVVIPNSVIAIGRHAFADTELTSVVIPDSVKIIEDGAFADCYLKSVSVGNSVTSIGDYAFNYNDLTSVTISGSVITIGSDAFSYNKLTEVTIPGSVTSLGVDAFKNNGSVSNSGNIPTSDFVGTWTLVGEATEWIKEGADFEFDSDTGTITGYNGLETDLVIPAKIDGVDVKVIGVTAFQSENLSSVVIPSSVTSIEADAFSYNDLTSLKIPNSVTIIGGFAFDSNKLTQVTIPDSVMVMGVGAFNNNKLPEDQAFIYARNADGSVDETIVVSYGGAKKDNVQIPSLVTTIGGYAFSYNDLISISIPNSVTTIEEYAFYKNKLTEVTIPGSVTSLGVDAFKDNGSISNSENIPTSDFVGTWTLVGAIWTK